VHVRGECGKEDCEEDRESLLELPLVFLVNVIAVQIYHSLSSNGCV